MEHQPKTMKERQGQELLLEQVPPLLRRMYHFQVAGSIPSAGPMLQVQDQVLHLLVQRQRQRRSPQQQLPALR